ncbi:MAG: hypothetical protein VKO00_05995 [Cyanobacteriota bacterium]|nr:hypothetical protein [Cyanobacteriota bacterium]
MTTLQDEMAALNHRLDHKLDTLKQLRRLYKTIALYISYLCYLCILLFLDQKYQPLLTTGRGWVITVLLSALPPLFYCFIMCRYYDKLWRKGRNKKQYYYSSFVNNEVNNSTVTTFHELLMNLEFGDEQKKL